MQQLSNLWSRAKALALGSVVVAGAIALTGNPAKAQAAYGSYIGIGGSFGLTEANGEGRENSLLLAARYKFLRLPVSLRAQGLIGSDGSAFVPTLSYDIPITWDADLYVAAGGSFVTGDNTPVGDRSSFAIQPGLDYSIPNSELVVFGNAIIAFDAYRDEDKAAVSLQGGIGIRF